MRVDGLADVGEYTSRRILQVIGWDDRSKQGGQWGAMTQIAAIIWVKSTQFFIFTPRHRSATVGTFSLGDIRGRI